MKIRKLSELPEQSVSHDPNLKKKVFLQNGEIPHLMNYSQAIIPAGSSVTAHTHQDMYEIFFVVAGNGELTVNDTVFELTIGTCFVIEPQEKHSLKNIGKADLILSYFGISEA